KSGLSPGEFIRAIRPIRRAVIDTPPAAMLGVDYLLGREDVDPERIILVGGSVGAVFVPAVAATDTRIAAAVMLFGAADIQTLLSANINATRWIAGPASWLGAVLTSPVEPAKYVADITPRPVFMLNGTGDPRMPEYCSRLLHETAKEPKSIRWIDAGHVNIRSKEFHSLVSRELAAWLIGQDLISRENFVETD
ncbi:MAG: prolyl oligopeptidase family serine peptidase, partial [Candidatus Krumholzibacteria bacterium]|nr:prolyl oligopeptidase family serine peptidase [Candidatus Krumholzibacteria bacterium]